MKSPKSQNLKIDRAGYGAVMDCAMLAKKRLLLTATPFINKMMDLSWHVSQMGTLATQNDASLTA